MIKSDYRKLVYGIINQKGFTAKKKLSQNFLMDDNIINKIISSAELDNNTRVIEIGPGLGALTFELIKNAKKVLLYEVDEELIPILEMFFAEANNLKILNSDFLKADIDRDINEYLAGDHKLVLISNLPYHITTPIIMKILEQSHKIDSMILMMQYEVARRITSVPNTKDYNALSIIIQHQTNAKYLFKVPKTVFNPSPNVDSAVIKLDIKKSIKEDNNDYKSFYKFVHNCFAQRRKTIVNNITSSYSLIEKSQIINLLNSHDLDERIRAEAIKLDDFIKLYDDFKKILIEEKENGVKED
jgi:16S rRNA (adenine1518-N6/adenine1519-N6)-dimethyltransferase